MRDARRELAAARLQLAHETTSVDPACIVEPALARALAAFRSRAERLLALPDVLGVGSGEGAADARGTDGPCLRVYTKHRLTDAALKRYGKKLPSHVWIGGKKIRVELVPLGRLERHAFVGQSLSTNVGGVVRFGTIGARAVHGAASDPVFITAMHVTGLRSFPDPGVPPLPVFVPGGGAAAIGQLIAGSQIGIDAAIVSVNTVLTDSVPLIGQLRGSRPILLPGDRGTRVRMFGSTSRRLMDGVIEEPLVDIPEFELDSAIVVRGFESVAGDSGAALVDPQNLVLGFLVGGTTSGRRLFCPVGLVLSRLQCEMPTVS